MGWLGSEKPDPANWQGTKEEMDKVDKKIRQAIRLRNTLISEKSQIYSRLLKVSKSPDQKNMERLIDQWKINVKNEKQLLSILEYGIPNALTIWKKTKDRCLEKKMDKKIMKQFDDIYTVLETMRMGCRLSEERLKKEEYIISENPFNPESIDVKYWVDAMNVEHRQWTNYNSTLIDKIKWMKQYFNTLKNAVAGAAIGAGTSGFVGGYFVGGFMANATPNEQLENIFLIMTVGILLGAVSGVILDIDKRAPIITS